MARISKTQQKAIRAAKIAAIRKWTIIVLVIAATTLNLMYAVKAGIRMVDDPKPDYNRMKVKIVDDGEVAFLFYDHRMPYKVGDMFTYVHRDSDGNPDFEGPKVVVLELIAVDTDGVDSVESGLPGKWKCKK